MKFRNGLIATAVMQIFALTAANASQFAVKHTGAEPCSLVVSNWAGLAGGDAEKLSGKVVDGDPVTIIIPGGTINYFAYSVSCDTKVDTIPLYGSLEKLFASGLNPLTKAGGLEAPNYAIPPSDGDGIPDIPSFLDLMRTWRNNIKAVDDGLGTFTDSWTKATVLSTNDASNLKKEVDKLNADLKSLDGDRKAAYDGIFYAEENAGSVTNTVKVPQKDKKTGKVTMVDKTTEYQISTTGTQAAVAAQQLYDAQLKRHEEVVARAKTFLATAKKTLDGQTLVIEGKKAGTKVTVTLGLTALDSDNAETATKAKQIVFKYMVSSNSPLFFHTGFAFRHLSDVTAEAVQKAGTDLFKLTETRPDNAAPVAFESYTVAVNEYGDPGVALTLGTEIANPGEKLYIGVTFNLLKCNLDLGSVTDQVDKGENLVTQDLYATFHKERKWGYFGAVSFSIP